MSDLLVARGYRVLARDLPGRGLSPRDPDSSVALAASAVVAFVGALPEVFRATRSDD